MFGYEYAQQLCNDYGLRIDKEFRKRLKEYGGEKALDYNYTKDFLDSFKIEVLSNKINIEDIDTSCFKNSFMQYNKDLYNLLYKCDFIIKNNYKNIVFENPKNLFIIIDDENLLSVCEKTSSNGEKALKNFQKIFFENNDFYKLNNGNKTLLDIIEKNKNNEYDFEIN